MSKTQRAHQHAPSTVRPKHVSFGPSMDAKNEFGPPPESSRRTTSTTSNDQLQAALFEALASITSTIATMVKMPKTSTTVNIISLLSPIVTKISIIATSSCSKHSTPSTSNVVDGDKTDALAPRNCKCMNPSCGKSFTPSRTVAAFEHSPNFCNACHASLAVEERGLSRLKKLAVFASRPAPVREGVPNTSTRTTTAAEPEPPTSGWLERKAAKRMRRAKVLALRAEATVKANGIPSAASHKVNEPPQATARSTTSASAEVTMPTAGLYGKTGPAEPRIGDRVLILAGEYSGKTGTIDDYDDSCFDPDIEGVVDDGEYLGPWVIEPDGEETYVSLATEHLEYIGRIYR